MSGPTIKLERVTVEAFDRYHAENPHIYEKLVEFALQAARAGVKRLGMQMLYGRLRWHSTIETVGDPWKLNDHYTAFYARKLMAEHKALVGMFELRASVADNIGPKKIMRELNLQRLEQSIPPAGREPEPMAGLFDGELDK